MTVLSACAPLSGHWRDFQGVPFIAFCFRLCEKYSIGGGWESSENVVVVGKKGFVFPFMRLRCVLYRYRMVETHRVACNLSR